jgi:alkylation response protein AidB-like acyl-CoA dehydrogenase
MGSCSQTRIWHQRGVVHSPSTLSQKYWITNSADHAQWCVVFAQTLASVAPMSAPLARRRTPAQRRKAETAEINEMAQQQAFGQHATTQQPAAGSTGK